MLTETLICSLSTYGLIEVSGKDAKKLLQGQLTCDVEKLTKTGLLGAHCNPQGRVISLFHLFSVNDAYYLIMPRSLIPIALSALKKYAIFFKVSLNEVSHHWTIFGYQGHPPDSVTALPIINQRYYLPLLPQEASSFLTQASDKKEITPEQWRLLNIEDYFPTIYAETSGLFLPHELNLPALSAVDFNKGCYTGQEIIARMHYKGKLKNHLYRGQLETTKKLIPGLTIEPRGTIVDAYHLSYNEVLLVTDDESAKNHQLHLAGDDHFFNLLTNE